MNQNTSQKIQNANREWENRLRSGDAAGIAALYTQDASLLPPNSDILSGNSAIQTFWQGVVKMGITDVELHSIEVNVLGDTAVEVGRYKLKSGDSEVDSGKYLVVWKNENGEWKIYRDVWNTSVPAATSQAA